MISAFQMTTRSIMRHTAGAAIAMVLVCSLSAAAWADEGDSLGALWWQHAMSIPYDKNPILDETGAQCGIGQTGDTWFLHGSFGGPQIVRDCSAPAGRRFFLPIVNWICLPYPGETIKENVDICQYVNDLTDTLELTVNGEPANQLIKRRAQRNPFDVTLPVDNILGATPGTYVAVHDGYYAMLPVLPPGNHTIHIVGGTSAFGFSLDVVYNLTVVEPAFISP